jgi:hypothetical protein
MSKQGECLPAACFHIMRCLVFLDLEGQPCAQGLPVCKAAAGTANRLFEPLYPSYSNVLLEEDLRACLGDLGVAQFVGSATHSLVGFCTTHEGTLLALPPVCRPQQHDMYQFVWAGCLSRCAQCPAAAPEQLLGESCTTASDLYSFGILLIELTTQVWVERRGSWRMPTAPQDCPQVMAGHGRNGPGTCV